MSVSIKSSLAGAVPASAGNPAEIGALRRRAFIEHGVAMIHLSDVVDPWTRQAVINEARRQLDAAPAAAGVAPAATRRRSRR